MKIKSFNNHVISEDIKYHVENDIPLGELYRVGSESYYRVFNEARRLYNEGVLDLEGITKEVIEDTEIGQFTLYEGEHVPLDSPMVEKKDKDVELNKPKRGGSKKFYVYVRDPKTKNVKKVEFGDTSGLKAKIDDPEARKSFVARHKCGEKKDKTKPGYWACRLPYYAKQLGLSGGGNFFW